MKTSAELLGESFQKARHHWRRHSTAELKVAPAQKPVPNVTVAISREEGSRGAEIARELGKRLDWPVYDRELITKIAEESGIREELLTTVDEKDTGWLVDVLEAFSGGRHVSGAAYAHQLGQVLAALSTHGNCVIVGRGAVALLPEATTVGVHVVAPLKDRAARVKRDQGLSDAEAKRLVEKTDHDRVSFVKNHFHKDLHDVCLYDLTLNTSRLKVEDCVELILCACERKKRQAAD